MVPPLPENLKPCSLVCCVVLIPRNRCRYAISYPEVVREQVVDVLSRDGLEHPAVLIILYS